MRKKSLFYALAVVFLFLLGAQVQGKENVILRVCLAQGLSSSVFSIESGSYLLYDEATNLTITKINDGDSVTVNKAGSNLAVQVNGCEELTPLFGPITAVPIDEAEINVFSFKNTMYRDAFVVTLDKTGLLVVNNIDIEHYLYGVVGGEIGAGAHKEALKAQAVVSRSYAMTYKGSNLKYDVGANTGTQVYGGYSAERGFGSEKVIDAVDATRDKVIYYTSGGKREIIRACFHANAGGYTENSENVWSESFPYLKGVPSPEDEYAEEYANETGQSWPAASYRWEKKFTYDEIEQAISAYNKKVSTPINIGQFREIRLFRDAAEGEKQTVSGRVTRVELVGSNGKSSIYKEAVRSLFELKSTKFDIAGNSSGNFAILDGTGMNYQIESIAGLKVIGAESSMADIRKEDMYPAVIGRDGQADYAGSAQGNVTFIGFGSGHGVGMSQWGARGMAAKGADYKEIIEHYYNQDKYDGKLTIERY